MEEKNDAIKDGKNWKVVASGASFVAQMLNTSSKAAEICAQEYLEGTDYVEKCRGRYCRSGVLHHP